MGDEKGTGRSTVVLKLSIIAVKAPRKARTNLKYMKRNPKMQS